MCSSIKSPLGTVGFLVIAIHFFLVGCGNENRQDVQDAGEDVNVQDAFEDSVGKERISTDAPKVDCGPSGPCPGTTRCFRPGNGDPECSDCEAGIGCPSKCLRNCLRRCFEDGTCDEPNETCVDGNAEGARVCLPSD
jgi:hypothetical protein